MTLLPVKDINEYKRVKEALRDRFEAERTGDQDLFREQSKILQPLINTQQQTVKAIKDGQDVNAVSNALLPFTRELQRRNDQVDMLAEQPFYQQELPAITPISPEFMKVDLDAGLNETDRENLEDMEFQLPSTVFKNKLIEETLEKIKTENRRIGQKLGTGPVGQKVEVNEKKVYQSRKKTLETYKQMIEGLEGAKQFVSTPKKAGKGLKHARGRTDVIYYPNVDDLCARLAQLDAAKQAGNNGVDNKINSILDELLRVQAIGKDEYDNLYKNIFN
jgi:hypothetical protein